MPGGSSAARATSAAKALPHADTSATATAAVAASQLTAGHSPLQVRLSPCQFCSPVGISCLLRHLRVTVALVHLQDLVPYTPVPTKLRTDRASRKPTLVGLHLGGLLEAHLTAGTRRISCNRPRTRGYAARPPAWCSAMRPCPAARVTDTHLCETGVCEKCRAIEASGEV